MVNVTYKETRTGEVKNREFETQAGAAQWIGTLAWIVAEEVLKVEFVENNVLEVA